MASALELKVIFAAVDKFVRPVKGITGAASEAAKALRENTARMKELDRTVAQIDAFKKAEKDAAITANTFAKTREQIDRLKAAIDKVGVPTKAQAAELANLSRKSEDLKAKHESLINTEQRLFEKLKAAGIDTRNLAEQRRNLASASSEAVNQSRRLQGALEAENQKMRRLKAAQADLDKAKDRAGKLALTGAGMAAGGAAISLPIAKAGKDFADFETAMLGVARQVDGAKDEAGKMTPLYWEMGDAIKAMSERLPMTANDIAKIVEGGARMGIQGKENLLIYADTTAVMASAFDLPVDQVGEDIGKISQLYKVPIKDIKSLGDTINWLDDNALAKGGDIVDVMKRIAGTADMVKMNFKEAAALGSTFLSLGANPEVAASASNAMIRELSIANMQGKRFQGGLAMLGLDGKALQASMATDATGTIIKVLEKIKGLAGDKQLEAATRLFGKEFGDDASKLASNLDEYRRQLKLVNDEKARGSMQRESDTRNETLNARIEMSKNAFTNLSSDLGRHLKPAIAETLERTLAIIQAVRAWAAENPALAGGLMTTVKGLALLLTVLGGLTIAAGAILVPLATMKFALATLGIGGGPVATALGGIASKLWAILGPIGKVTAAFAAAFAAGYAIGTLLNSAIDAGLSKLLGYETTLGGATYDLVQKIKGGLGDAVDWVANLPGRFVSAGTEMINGLITGIGSRLDALRQTVSGAADGAVAWVKEKLGIRSPSRVFAELGMHTMAGFEQGIAANGTGPLDALGAITKKLAALGAAVTLGQPALAIPEPVTPPAIVREIGERFHPAALPALAAGERTVTDRHQPIALPAIPEALRAIVDQHQDAALPGPLDAVRRIRDQHLAEPPAAPADAERTVTDRHQPAALPAPLAALRRIIDTHLPITLPAIPEAIRSLIDQQRPAELPGPLDTVRRISDVHQALQLPAPPDAIRHVRDIVGELPEIPAAQREQATRSAPPVIRSQPAAGPAHAAAPADAGGNTYHITINAPAGSDAPALAALVAREIERIEAGRSAQRRSRLRDLE